MMVRCTPRHPQLRSNSKIGPRYKSHLRWSDRLLTPALEPERGSIVIRYHARRGTLDGVHLVRHRVDGFGRIYLGGTSTESPRTKGKSRLKSVLPQSTKSSYNGNPIAIGGSCET
jgi:hypothetical protein